VLRRYHNHPPQGYQKATCIGLGCGCVSVRNFKLALLNSGWRVSRCSSVPHGRSRLQRRSALQALPKTRPTAAQRAVLGKCGKDEIVKEQDTTRRQALVAGITGVGAIACCNAGNAKAAADAYEIPTSQQCLECTGSGIISCASHLKSCSACPSLADHF
jgi:hypothetical protein